MQNKLMRNLNFDYHVKVHMFLSQFLKIQHMNSKFQFLQIDRQNIS